MKWCGSGSTWKIDAAEVGTRGRSTALLDDAAVSSWENNGEGWYPHGESNPGLQTENLALWVKAQ